MIKHGRILPLLVAVTLFAVAGSVCAQSAATLPSGTTGTLGVSSTTARKIAKRADRKLAHRVETALARAHGLNVTRIFVKAHSGQITLSGSVPNNEQIPLAVNAAQRVDGVKEVKNLLRITPQAL